MAGSAVPYFKSASTVKSEEEEGKYLNCDIVTNSKKNTPQTVLGVQHVQIIKQPASEHDYVRSASPYTIFPISPSDPALQDGALSLNRAPSPGARIHLVGHPFAASPTPSAILPPVQPMTVSESVMVHSSTQLISSDTSISFKTVPKLSPCKNSVAPIKTETQSLNPVISPAKKGTVRKVIIIQPGEDAEHATARAMQEITENLNKQAAERLAEGRTPEKETRIEITRIKAPNEGYFCRDNMLGSQQKRPSASLVSLVSTSGDSAHQHNRRKSPHPKRHMYHVPTPPQKGDTLISTDTDDCYFSPNNSSIPKVCSYPTAIDAEKAPASVTMGPLQMSSASAVLGAASSTSVFSSTICRPSISQRPAILRNSAIRIINRPGTSSAGQSTSNSLSSSSDSDSGADIKKTTKLNDSLTNIQWLGTMSSEKLGPPHRDLRIYPSEKQIEKISRECGKKKRPPYSYMHLIQMAICSKPDRKMTLREIYRWIEDKFPYYGHSSNQGWKNSIRHNLSLYDIFVREKPNVPGRTGSSYWTIRSDLSLKTTKAARTIITLDSSTTTLMEPSSPSPSNLSVPSHQSSSYNQYTPTPCSNSSKNKKGPVPIQPRPPALHTFALIPIQGGVSVPGQQMAMVSPWRVGSPQMMSETSNSQSETASSSVLKTSQKRVNSPMEVEGPKRKQVKIATTVNVLDENHTVQQQTLNSSQSSNSSLMSSNALSNTLDTSELRSQFSRIQVDSGLELSVASSGRDTPSSDSDISIAKRGLPKPKLYGSSRRKQNLAACVRTTPSSLDKKPKQEGTLLSLNSSAEASESGISDILASIEKDLSSPMKNLLRTPPKETDKSLLTSTPFKGVLSSPSWMSPIKSLTPIAGEDVMGIALITPDQGTHGGGKTSTPLTPDGKVHLSPLYNRLSSLGGLTPLKLIPRLSPSTPGQHSETPGKCEGSPNMSFKDINNQSFSKLLGEFHLDSLIDEGINLDMSNISFSAFQ